MVELNVKIDGIVAKVSDAESDDGVARGEGRVGFELGPCLPRVLVDCLFLDDMEVVFRRLSPGGDLVARVFFYTLVKALDLVFRKVVVESDREPQLDDPQTDQQKKHTQL